MEPKNFHQLSITYLTWWDRQENPLKVIYDWHRSLWADTFRSDILYWQPDTQDNVLSISQVLTPIGIHWYNECFLQPPYMITTLRMRSSRVHEDKNYRQTNTVTVPLYHEWQYELCRSISYTHRNTHTHTHTHTPHYTLTHLLERIQHVVPTSHPWYISACPHTVWLTGADIHSFR